MTRKSLPSGKTPQKNGAGKTPNKGTPSAGMSPAKKLKAESPKMPTLTPQKTPKGKPGQDGGISAKFNRNEKPHHNKKFGKDNLKKLDSKSVTIHKGKPKIFENKKGDGKQEKKMPREFENNKFGGKKNKNRAQRMQQAMSKKVREPADCALALKTENELSQTKGRVFNVKLQDPEITVDIIKGWSGAVENALFPKPVEARSFMIVLKPDADIKKELATLRKVQFGGKNIVIEEKADRTGSVMMNDKSIASAADFIDPHTL